MDRRTIISLILVTIVISAGLLFYESDRIRQESMTHSYRYAVTIESTGAVSNCSLIVPVGSVDGSSAIADAIEYGQMTGLPADWSLMLLTTDDAVFLKISTPGIRGATPATPMPIGEEQEPVGMDLDRHTPVVLAVVVDSESAIDTADPAGSEPLLEPRRNQTPIDCSFPYPDEMPLSCYRYTIPMYASYMTENDTVLSVTVELVGENAWWMGGWNGNSYSDRVHLTLSGPFPGWTTVEGTSVFGLGNY